MDYDFVGLPGDPRKANTSDSIRQDISNDCGVAVGSWKICMKLRGMPVSNSGHNHTFNVTHYILEKY